MAGPITHIALALKILCLLPLHIDKKEFLVGTSFPDIRYRAHLERSVTHIEPVSWLDVINEPSSFRAGMLFHNLVDIIRMKYFEPYFFDKFSTQYSPVYIKWYPTVLKMAEDAMLYEMVGQWSEIISYFNIIYAQETTICSDEHIVKEWHAVLQYYFQQKPIFSSALNLLSPPVGQDTLPAFNIQEFFDNFLINNDFYTKLMAFYNSFELLLPHKPITSPISKEELCVARGISFDSHFMLAADSAIVAKTTTAGQDERNMKSHFMYRVNHYTPDFNIHLGGY